MVKAELIKKIALVLEERLNDYKLNLLQLMESRNSDTKSSAGDKYETSREMAQIEMNKLTEMVLMNGSIVIDLAKIDANITHQTVELGSIVITNTDKYFISVAFGKIKLDDEEYYAISKTSPFALAIKGKKVGDSISFQNREINIVEIY